MMQSIDEDMTKTIITININPNTIKMQLLFHLLMRIMFMSIKCLGVASVSIIPSHACYVSREGGQRRAYAYKIKVCVKIKKLIL